MSIKTTIQNCGIFAFALWIPVLGGGCGITPLAIAEDDVAVDAAQAAADSAILPEDLASSADEGVDKPPVGCDPACAPWQSCGGVTCAPKICTADNQCAGGAADAPHYCYRHSCQAFQCADDSDCPGAKCNTLTYLCMAKQTGCKLDAECLDANACTDDTCDLKTAQCVHKLGYGCCNSAGDCNDALPCTTDGCQGGFCTHVSKANCCNSAGECGDSNACTVDACQAGTCTFTPIAACCQGDGGCDDGQPGSFDQCVQHQCIHQWSGLPTTCAAAKDCGGNACLTGACVAGKCSYVKGNAAGCCSEDSVCTSKDKTCTASSCVAAQCATQAIVGVGPHVWQHFDAAALDGWQVKKDHPTVYFHWSTLAMLSGAGALRYGVPAKVSFESGNANKGSVTSPAIAVPSQQAALTFWLYLDVEPGTAVHQCGLDVIDSAGVVTASVWSKNKDLQGGTTGQQWKQQSVSLAQWAGKSVQLRFWFDQVKFDMSNKDKLGMVVDELQLVGACP